MFKTVKNTGLYTDYYELTMAQGYFLSNRHGKHACFDYFFRTNPYGGGYVAFAGLSSVLDGIENFRFGPEACEYLHSLGFNANFIRFLSEFSFTGSVWSVREGEIIFPGEPVLRVEGNILETQLIETLVLNFLNFESLIATKASRIRLAAGDKTLLEFGLRRAQGMGGIQATKAAISGGFDKTSNVYSANLFGLEGSGTMAHSWIQSFDDELTAFRTYAKWFPDNCVLLADTYNTLKSGIPNAITVALELKKRGHRLTGIRLDSGDFTSLSKKARKMFDEAGLHDVKIIASNQLDEFTILNLLAQGAPIDIFGVGTSLVTGQHDAALDGVYKLSHLDGKATAKLSETNSKATLPGVKTIHRFINGDNQFYADGISLEDEIDYSVIYHPVNSKKYHLSRNDAKEVLMHQCMKDGKQIQPMMPPHEVAAYHKKRLQQLPEEYKRFSNPQLYPVGITGQVTDLRDRLAKSFLNR